jgi:hypothetical protein
MKNKRYAMEVGDVCEDEWSFQLALRILRALTVWPEFGVACKITLNRELCASDGVLGLNFAE